MLILMIGMLFICVGLTIGLFRKSWIALLCGIGITGLGIVIGNIPIVYLASQVKSIDPSLNAKQAHDLVVRHLREHGSEADDTKVFLGKFIGETEWRERQRRSRYSG